MQKQEQPQVKRILKTIGSTTYEIHIHFSSSSKETLNDKIKRLLKNDLGGL